MTTELRPWAQKGRSGTPGASGGAAGAGDADSTARKPAPVRTPGYSMGHLNDYELIQQLGKGTFGVVSKARQRRSGKLVALKQFIVHDRKDGFPITSFREITIMKKLHNLNVLQLVDMVHERKDDDKAVGYFYTVTPYISSDLNGLLNNPRVSLTLPQIKCIMKQVLQGIDYVHGQSYLHRDIKTANILLDHFGIVKLADFGLARVYHGPPPATPDSPPGGGRYEYTGLVVTRWYRPPELLLGDRRYTTAVDMWGIGCVFGEMYKRKPILEGSSDLDQADQIFRLVGAPTDETFPHYKEINRNKVNIKVDYKRTLEEQYKPLMREDATELLSGLLTLDPKKRFNAKRALESVYFTSDPKPCLPADLPKFEESHESDVKRFKSERHNAETSIPHSKYGATVPEIDRSMSMEFANRSRDDPYPPPPPPQQQSWTSQHKRRRGGGYNGRGSHRGGHDGENGGRGQRIDVWRGDQGGRNGGGGGGRRQRRRSHFSGSHDSTLPDHPVTLPSASAKTSDLYGSKDQNFSAMKRFLHKDNNRQKKDKE